jgi:uncharacterized lipoprotein NlpE involved in copper resistance
MRLASAFLESSGMTPLRLNQRSLEMRKAISSGVVIALVGCGGGAKNEAPPAAAPAPVAPQASAAAFDTGVAECDDYLTKYTACIDQHVPEAMRSTFRQSMDQTRAAWKQANTTTPEAKQALASACTTAMDAAKQAMAAYGCSW